MFLSRVNTSVLVLAVVTLIKPTVAFTPTSSLKIYSVSSFPLFMGDAATDDVPNSEPTDGSKAQENESQLPSQASSGMDILNSPQFLTRKRDVLINDIQKIQNDIILAKERLQQNKDEWGAQIADLQKEYEMIQ